MPKAFSTWLSWLSGQVRDMVANAVPQPVAKSEAKVVAVEWPGW